MKAPRVVFYGLGTIGRAAAKLAIETGAVEVVGGIDPRKDLQGKDVGEVVEARRIGVAVAPSLAALAGLQADAAVHATESRVALVAKQIHELVDAGLTVVTSCEEMLYPWHAAKKEADELDARAKERGVCVFGAGVNPGFVMDRLPATCLIATSHVRRVAVRRVVDSLTRRPQLRVKTGAGMTAAEFEKLVQAGRMGHIGLVESALFVARALERLGHERVEKIRNVTEPVIAAHGLVAGVHQICEIGLVNGTVIHLDLTIAEGAERPGDTVEIEGDPPVRFEIPGGVAGDTATASALVNAVAVALHAEAGIARL